MGTPQFAVATLEALISHAFEVVAVVTAPDKPSGRGLAVTESAVKKYAVQHHLPVLQPTNLKDEAFAETLKKLNADVQIVVAFRMLPEKIWDMPPLGTFNLHASLLPKYRGAAPINWAIIKGEKETGITTFKLQHEIDTGGVLYSEKVQISENTSAGELHDELMHLGAELMLKTVKALEKSWKEQQPLQFITQKDEEATHAPKLNKDTCRIRWDDTLQNIHNLIRGLSPHPGAFTSLVTQDGQTKTVKLYLTKRESGVHANTNGLLITDNKTYLKVACTGGYLCVEELQMEGKKRMHVGEFLRGFRPDSGMCFY